MFDPQAESKVISVDLFKRILQCHQIGLQLTQADGVVHGTWVKNLHVEVDVPKAYRKRTGNHLNTSMTSSSLLTLLDDVDKILADAGLPTLLQGLVEIDADAWRSRWCLDREPIIITKTDLESGTVFQPVRH